MFGFIDTPGSAVTPGARIGLLVDTPEVEMPAPVNVSPPSDPFDDWEPAEFGERLTRGRMRWGLLTSMLVLFAGAAVAALWLFEQPREEARRIREALDLAIADTEAGLADFRDVSATIDQPTIDTAAINRALLDLEDDNRRMFSAAGALPSEQTLARGRVIEVSGTISQLQNIFSDLYTYRLAVLPVLVPPTLETDPTLTTLEDAATAFSEWEAKFNAVLAALPDGVLPDVSARLRGTASALPDIQSGYLDGLRTEDAEAAARAIGTLERSLAQSTAILLQSIAEQKQQITESIEKALTDLAAVPLMLG